MLSKTPIVANGNAAVPATVNETKETAEIPLPKDSEISYVPATSEAPGKFTIRLAGISSLSLTKEGQQIKGPTSYQPPSPGEIARAEGVRWFYFAGLGSALLAFLFLYLQHVKAAGFAFAAAIGCPLAGTFLGSQSASLVLGVMLAVSVALYFAWHLMRQHPEIITDLEAQIKAKITSPVSVT